MSVKCLIYCCKAKPNLYKTNFVKIEDIKKGFWDKLVYEIDNNERLYLNGEKKETLNGKIVASFDCEKVEVFTTDYRGNKEQNKIIVKESCVPLGNLVDYQKENHLLYAIHISNLEIFDKPKELNEYKGECINKKWSYCPSCKVGYEYISEDEAEFYRAYGYCSTEWVCLNWLKKAPQNMCYCYDQERKTQYVLISIRPEWVAKILNGEKTIEVRKQVVNSLKELI